MPSTWTAASSSRPIAWHASAAPCSMSCGPWIGCHAWCAARPAKWKRRARTWKRPWADHHGVSLEEYNKTLGDATAVSQVSLNKKWYETDSYKDVREIDILEDKKAEDPTHRLQNRDLMRLVTRGLNRNERLIIILYYYEDMTMKEIGATLDLSESRVSQMHSSIVARLQQQLAKRRPEFSN